MSKLNSNQNNNDFTALFKSGNLNVEDWAEISRIYSNKNNENERLNQENEECVDLQIDVTNLVPSEPTDGGWGWFIVLGSFLILGLTDGIVLSYGFFLGALQESFDGVTNLEMMFASSVLGGSYLIMGPVASAMSNQFGFRALVISGGIVSTTSMLISSFMPNITSFILTFGLAAGMGFSLSYLPGATIIALWFKDRRATATGIALCGSSFSASVFSIIIPILIDRYSWRGCLLILAAINCNCFVAAAFFRPITYPTAEVNLTKPEIGVNETGDMNKLIEDLALQTIMGTIQNENTNTNTAAQQSRRQSIIDLVLTAKHQDKLISNGSLNTMIITTQNDGLAGNVDEFEVNKVQMVQNILSRYFNKRAQKSNSHVKSHINLLGNSTVLPVGSFIHSQTSLNYAVVSQPQLFHNSGYNIHRSVLSLAPLKEHKISVTAETVKEISVKLGREMARPHMRPDLFYQGSMNHLNNENLYRSRSDSRVKKQIVENVVDIDSPARGAFQQLLDFSILNSYTMKLFLALNFLNMFVFMVPYQFIIMHAHNNGLVVSQSALLLTIMGLASCVGRIGAGFIADQPWSNCVVLHNFSIIVGGLDTIALQFITGFPGLIIFSIIYGLFTASSVSLKTIVVVDVMGPDKLTNVFGWTLLSQGFGMLFGPPAMGCVYDIIQNLNTVFCIGGIIMTISGLMGLPLSRMARKEYLKESI